MRGKQSMVMMLNYTSELLIMCAVFHGQQAVSVCLVADVVWRNPA
jgi:hypothetical protein